MSDTDKEISILENIYSQPNSVKQRDLAHIAGISLGMTNSILKRLIEKGLLTARKINHRNIHYAVTPTGINEIMKRSYRYLKSTVKLIALYREKIDKLVLDIKALGYATILLVGESDLQFIFEHCCQRMKIGLQTIPTEQALADCDDTIHFIVFNEKIIKSENHMTRRHTMLYQLLQDIHG